jgi:predicted deacylase
MLNEDADAKPAAAAPQQQQLQRRNVLCNNYLWVDAPVSGMLYSEVSPADYVEEGEVLGTFCDFGGDQLAELVSTVLLSIVILPRDR